MSEARVESLLGRLTLEEKVSLVSGSDSWHTTPIPRLGVGRLRMSDGPIGARGDVQKDRKASACFPAAVALGATWDPDLVAQVGAALADEARAKGAHVLLAPTINLQRNPLGGRGFECYSEDPLLTAAIATAYVRGLQGAGIGACLKHFVCNESERQRRAADSRVSERAMRELYLRPFQDVIRDADPWCVMSAYNRVNGEYASSHRELLREILKDEWSYPGVVISDWGAAKDPVRDARAGLDLEMPGPARVMGPRLLDAVRRGDVEEKEIDDKVRRLLRLLERAGRLDRQDEAEARAEDRPEHRALARRAAAEGMVLLQNDGVLPLAAGSLRTLAVIGPNADPGQIMGGGSAFVIPHRHLGPLEALRARLPQVAIAHEIGCSIERLAPEIALDQLSTDAGVPGLAVEYWNGPQCEGEIAATGHALQTRFLFGRSAPLGVDAAQFSARYRGRFTARQDGLHVFGILATGRSRLFLDDREQIDSWSDPLLEEDIFGSPTSLERRAAVQLEAGRSYALRIEFSRTRGPTLATLRFGVQLPEPADRLQRAVAAARAADAAIVVVGTSGEWETEGRDRDSLELPGRQDELIEAVAAVQPRTVVVVNAGSPVAMDWSPRVSAVLMAWFAGQELGDALADVLLGEIDPCGRLPMTIPVRLQDVPALAPTAEQPASHVYAEDLEMGYRGFEARGIAPRFAFGHGLTYTRFEIAQLQVPGVHRAGSVAEVSCRVRNAGPRAGREVVQLYVRALDAPLPWRGRELRAFAKVSLVPGEEREVRLAVGDRAFASWDPARRALCVHPGRFEIAIGASARDIRASAVVQVRPPGGQACEA